MPRNAAEIAGLNSARLSAPIFLETGKVIDKRVATTGQLANAATAFSADQADTTWVRKILLFVKSGQNYDVVLKRYADGSAATIPALSSPLTGQAASAAAYVCHEITVTPGTAFAIGIKNVSGAAAGDFEAYMQLHG